METTKLVLEPKVREFEEERLEEELAMMSAHLNAATARWLELTSAFRREGGAAGEDFACWLAFRCGISQREAREYLRVAEALEELPLIRDSFRRGELTFTKVRALTRVATARSEQGLLELAFALSASQLERALRAFRRIASEQTRETHELEYLDYYFAEDGSLYLRARLPAEDGTLLVRALEAARERVWERRRVEQAQKARDERAEHAARDFEPPRSPQVEALVDLAQTALCAPAHDNPHARMQLVVHVDAATLTGDHSGRSELEDGPVLAPETARRLGCDADVVTSIERHGLPLSIGRRRRSVPTKLRRLLEARDEQRCRFAGCERRRYLDAHHVKHWAQGGETTLENLVLLCFHHHRLVHEGGYTIQKGANGELRFRNRHGVFVPGVPRSPPGDADGLIGDNEWGGLEITPHTNQNGCGDRMDLALAVAALDHAACQA